MEMNTPANTNSRPLWQRLLIRRLKFIGIIAALIVVLLGGSYLFAPQWLLNGYNMHEAMNAQLEKHSVQAGDTALGVLRRRPGSDHRASAWLRGEQGSVVESCAHAYRALFASSFRICPAGASPHAFPMPATTSTTRQHV